MSPQKRMTRLRDAGVTPTMQRLAILEYLEGTKAHPTADEIYAKIQKTCPTIARATVYNTLEALTKSGTILQLTVDPGAARYDADTGPTALPLPVAGIRHRIEALPGTRWKATCRGRGTYAFGVAPVPQEPAPAGKPSAGEDEGIRAERRRGGRNSPELLRSTFVRGFPALGDDRVAECSTQLAAAENWPGRVRGIRRRRVHRDRTHGRALVIACGCRAACAWGRECEMKYARSPAAR
jgi:hypothetical protein